MKSTAYLAAILVSISAGSMACAVDGTAPSPTTETAKSEGELSIVSADGKLSGTYKLAEQTLKFDVARLDELLYSVTIKTGDMTLDATFTHSAASYDGYASASGDDTLLNKADQPLLASFDKALGAKLGQMVKDGNREADLLTRTAGVWAEWPTNRTLSRRVLAEEGRSWTSLCSSVNPGGGAKNVIVKATHDCTSPGYSRGANNSSVYAYIGNYGNSTTSYSLNGSPWSTTSLNHASLPYEYGDCFGRCGADCGSSTTYTTDCNDHDSCVRNGHMIASLYCQNEFDSCTDDALATWLGGAPNC